MITDQDLAALDQAERAATPWMNGYMGAGTGWPECWAKHFKIETDIAWPVYNDDKQSLDKPSAVFTSCEDQRLYYFSRNHLRELLDEVSSLRAFKANHDDGYKAGIAEGQESAVYALKLEAELVAARDTLVDTTDALRPGRTRHEVSLAIKRIDDTLGDG